MTDVGDAPPPVRRTEAAFLVVGTVALAAAVIGTRWGVFTPDTRPDLYQHPGSFLRSTLQAWVGGSSGLGQGNFNAGAAPVAAVVWVIRSLGASPWLAVRIWRLMILLVGAWGIRHYLGTLMGHRLSVSGRVLATVFWVVNPYVIVAGSTTPILLPYALLPWTLVAFVRATREPRTWKWPALFALGFFAQTGLNAGVVPFFQLLALPAHVVHARWVEGRRTRDLIRVLWRSGVCALAVSLYWLLPSFLAAGTGAGIATGTEDPADVARTSSYAETFRLLGNWPLYGRSGDRLFLGGYSVYLTSAPVLVASFLVSVAVGLGLWRSRARERLLAAVMLATALPVMVGLFPGEDPYLAGSLLAFIFEKVPASLAFRTTNKVGAVVVLAETLALVMAWRAWQARTRDRGRPLRWGAVVVTALIFVAAAAPLWNGSLYPLGYTIPDSWEQATADLDGQRGDQRVLVLPGGIGGNYRWGMRSPDDLFPSLLDRPVAVRNTVVGRGDPTGNFLSAFDTALAQRALSDTAISTTARYLGAGDVLVRNDLLTEEIGGPAPWVVVDQADADIDLNLTDRYGTPGDNTVPGRSGPVTRKAARIDPLDAEQYPLQTYEVIAAQPIIAAEPAAQQVLVVGDGEAFPILAREGILTGNQPVRYVGDLEGDAFADAVDRGGRIVLTDTNRRRAWDVNRVANATSPTLGVADDIDGGNGATTTLWPDQPADQTVSIVTGRAQVGADRPAFGVHPYGRPTNAFDGDPTTAWVTGGFNTAEGASVWIDLPSPRRIDQVTVIPYVTEPSSIEAISVRVGSKRVVEAVPDGGGPILVNIEPSVADRVEVTILEQTGGDNPVGLAEVQIDDTTVRNVTRPPTTLTDRVQDASTATQAKVAALPLDVVFTRQRGSVLDLSDDEESQLDRRFTLPHARSFQLTASLSSGEADAEILALARAGEHPCRQVAVLDGEPLEAKVVSSRTELADGLMRLEGCGTVALDAGTHDLQTIFGFRLNTFRLASAGTAPSATAEDTKTITVRDRSATHVVMDVEASEIGDRYIRLGEALDSRWTLSVDGVDAGPPILVDGYSTGWVIDDKAHRLEARFGPQRAVQGTFVVSAAGLVGVTALAVLPGSVLPPRRRQQRVTADVPSGAAP